jgi:transcriptional regulator with XRE-family HTH domain
MNYKKQMSDLIRNARTSNNLTQVELGEIMAKAYPRPGTFSKTLAVLNWRNRISRYESGKSVPSAVMFLQIINLRGRTLPDPDPLAVSIRAVITRAHKTYGEGYAGFARYLYDFLKISSPECWRQKIHAYEAWRSVPGAVAFLYVLDVYSQYAVQDEPLFKLLKPIRLDRT